jgi:hypothetical protein
VWDRIVVVLEPGASPDAPEKDVMKRAAAVVAADQQEVGRLHRLDYPVWHRHWSNSEGSLRSGVPAFVQPVSLVLTSHKPLASLPERSRTADTDKDKPLPVWMYWEGERPEWIRSCEQTVTAHAADVRILAPEDFDRLRDRDRDIDLARLHVVQRADYIRAFLLARYGGLWVDSDCIVMRSLAPVMDIVKSCEFVAHKERKGWYCNDLMGAPPDSRIAAALYARICQQLRSGRPIGWTALGCEVVTAVLRSTDAPWRELDCELVQPICWSRPEPYFDVATPGEHDRNLNRRAFCYMLSNQEVQKFVATRPGRKLTDDGTFFRHLIDRSLRPFADIAAPDPASEHIPFFVASMAAIAPVSVLDIGIGSGRWAFLMREIHESTVGRQAHPRANLRLKGVTIGAAKPRKIHRQLYDHIEVAAPEAIENGLNERWELIILGEELARLPKDQCVRLLDRALDAADYVLLGRWVREESHENSCPQFFRWSLRESLLGDVVRYSLFHRQRGIAYAAFLFSRGDPCNLRQVSPMESIFAGMARDCSTSKMESVSGPGSSLAQTTEMRQRLPQLLQSIGAQSLLDAPCGDFNWMRQVALGVKEYTGVDVLKELVETNQKQYGGNGRRFLQLDLSSDVLPRADVILCRDCLVHFSFHDIMRTLANFRRGGSSYLLMTTFPHRTANADIQTGGWRPLNFELGPFRLPPPLRLINEKCTEDNGRYADKSLGLWKLDDLSI